LSTIWRHRRLKRLSRSELWSTQNSTRRTRSTLSRKSSNRTNSATPRTYHSFGRTWLVALQEFSPISVLNSKSWKLARRRFRTSWSIPSSKLSQKTPVTRTKRKRCSSHSSTELSTSSRKVIDSNLKRWMEWRVLPQQSQVTTAKSIQVPTRMTRKSPLTGKSSWS
jgi:hypothetical protein